MIPRTLHQLWIGPDPAPHELIRGWRRAHRRWRHRLWTPPELDDPSVLVWNPAARAVYERYLVEQCWHGAANVARVEILRTHGGVWIDADMRCLHSLDGAPFLAEHVDFFVSESPHRQGRTQNAAMGAEPWHKILDTYSQALGQVRRLRPAWRYTGAGLLDTVLDTYPTSVAYRVPAWAFHPRRADGTPTPRPINHGPTYADHYFHSTRISPRTVTGGPSHA